MTNNPSGYQKVCRRHGLELSRVKYVPSKDCMFCQMEKKF